MVNIFSKILNLSRKKSPWILHYDTGGCNGCDIEILATLTPMYDVERFGIVEKGNPRHSDILIVTGAVTIKSKSRLKKIYDQMPNPKAVIAVGSCGITKGIFKDAYNVCGPVDKIIPVDMYVPGCPPKPEAIIDGVVKTIALWEKKFKD